MQYKVDPWNNFCEVIEIPASEDMPAGFCHSGGHSFPSKVVDWFYPVSQDEVPIAGCSKETYEKEVGKYYPKNVGHDELFHILSPFVSKKKYIRENKRYLVVCDFGASFVINPKTT